jgi:tyrosine-protein phosphatase YwqE
LQSRGYTPILAHPERYPYWYHSFDKYHQLFDKGVVLQLNLASVTGHYGTGPKRIAERLIDNNLITLLGSDIHKMSHLDVYARALKEPMLNRLLDSGQLMNAYL